MWRGKDRLSVPLRITARDQKLRSTWQSDFDFSTEVGGHCWNLIENYLIFPSHPRPRGYRMRKLPIFNEDQAQGVGKSMTADGQRYCSAQNAAPGGFSGDTIGQMVKRERSFDRQSITVPEPEHVAPRRANETRLEARHNAAWGQPVAVKVSAPEAVIRTFL